MIESKAIKMYQGGVALQICGRDFPGGPVVKNLPSNAGNTGLIPGWATKIPHAAGQLSLHTAATQPVPSGAYMLQLEKPPTYNKRSHVLQLRPNTAK